jgi:hypothetical protein
MLTFSLVVSTAFCLSYKHDKDPGTMGSSRQVLRRSMKEKSKGILKGPVLRPRWRRGALQPVKDKEEEDVYDSNYVNPELLNVEYLDNKLMFVYLSDKRRNASHCTFIGVAIFFHLCTLFRYIEVDGLWGDEENF